MMGGSAPINGSSHPTSLMKGTKDQSNNQQRRIGMSVNSGL